jgi:hypothetical protein
VWRGLVGPFLRRRVELGCWGILWRESVRFGSVLPRRRHRGNLRGRSRRGSIRLLLQKFGMGCLVDGIGVGGEVLMLGMFGLRFGNMVIGRRE